MDTTVCVSLSSRMSGAARGISGAANFGSAHKNVEPLPERIRINSIPQQSFGEVKNYDVRVSDEFS